MEDPCPRDPARVYIYVSDSPLGPFKGAFARKSIVAGVRIAQYTGRYTNKGSHTHYVLHDPVADIYRDAWDHTLQRVRCLAGFLNDPLDQHRANCKFPMVNGRMYVETIVPIPAHDELLVPYGDEYWLNNNFDANILGKAYAEYKKEATMERWQNKIATAKDGTTPTESNGNPIQQSHTAGTSTSQSTDRGDGTRTLPHWPWTLDDNKRRRPEMVRVSVDGATLSLRIPGLSAPRTRLLNDIRNNIHDRDLLGNWLHSAAGAIFYLSVPADNTMYSSCTPDGLWLPRAIKMALARADGLTPRDIPIRSARCRLQLATWIQEQMTQLADNEPPLYVQDNTPIPITGTLERMRRMSEWLLYTTSTSYPRTYVDGSPNWGHSMDIIPILAGRGPDADPIALFEQ
eukprot:gene42193-biopygen10011